MMNEKINEAVAFAVQAHSTQPKKGTEIPYIFHPMEAGAIASRITGDEDIICAAVLHDVVEDAKTPLDVIEEKFGKRIACLVDAESEDKTKSWDERKAHTVESIKNASKDVKIIMLCDKLSNIRALYADHLNCGEELWKRFSETDPAKHKKYYTGLVDGLGTLTERPEYKEFSSLVSELFRPY